MTAAERGDRPIRPVGLDDCVLAFKNGVAGAGAGQRGAQKFRDGA